MSDEESEVSYESEEEEDNEDDEEGLSSEKEKTQEEEFIELQIAAEEGHINQDIASIMEYVSYLYENKSDNFVLESDRLLNTMVLKLTRQDLIFKFMPDIKNHNNRYEIKNLYTLTTQFKNYRKLQVESLGIDNIRKYGGINVSTLYSVVTQNKAFNLMNIRLDDIKKLLVWYSIYNPEWTYNQLKVYGTKKEWFAYWSSLYTFYLIRTLFDENPKDVLNDLNKKPYCYVIYLGTYDIDGIYKHLIKIGKTNRKNNKAYGRLIEHQKTNEYPDCIVVGIYPCTNETDLENKIKEYLQDYHVNWTDKDEIYYVDGVDVISGLIQTIKKFIDGEASLDKLEELKADIAKKDMQIEELKKETEALTAENKEKDEIIADLMAQLAKEKAEKNKINKMNQQLARTTKIQAMKLREKS